MKRFFLIFGLLTVGLSGASAQIRLTLDKAVELALSENPTIRVADLEVRRYDYVKRQTWGNLLPQVNVTGQVNHQFIVQQMSKGFSLGNDPYTTLSGAVDASLPLFAPQVYRTMKLNQTQMAAAVEAARSSRITLVAEVRKAYYNILLAKQSLEVLRESEATVRRTVEDTKLKYDNGLASEYDLLTAQVQLSNLRPTILQTETSIRLAELQLKMYLSIPEQVEIEVTGELDGLRDEVLAGTDGLTADPGENSDLRTLELQEELLRRQLKAENAGRLPTIGAFGNFTLTGNNMGTVMFDMEHGGMTSVKDGYFWQNPLYAGIRISVPLFAGLTKVNRSRELKNQIAQIGKQREYAREQIGVQVRAALNDLMTARETMFAQEKTVEQAHKAYSIADTRYRAGAGTILELNTAQLAETQARLGFSQSIYDYLSAKAEYDRIVGRER